MDQDVLINTFISTYSSEKGYLLSEEIVEIPISHPKAIEVATQVLEDGDGIYLQGSLELVVNGITVFKQEEDWSSDILFTWETICNLFVSDMRDNKKSEIIFLDNYDKNYFTVMKDNSFEFIVSNSSLNDEEKLNTVRSFIESHKLKAAILEEITLFLDIIKGLTFDEESSYQSLLETYEALRK